MINKLLFVLLLVLPTSAGAVPDVSVSIHRFKAGEGNYAEVSIYIVGSSLSQPKDSVHEYGVEYSILIHDQQTGTVSGNRYRLTSLENPVKDLIDVKRFYVKPGKYLFEFELTDIHDPLNALSLQQEVEIQTADPSAKLSDIQLLSVIRNDDNPESVLHKSGLYLEPLPFNHYYPSISKLNVYVESYDMDSVEGQPYLQYTIKPAKGEIPAPIVAYRKVAKAPIATNALQLDIESLISGEYILETVLFDGNKSELASRVVNFSRSNPYGDSLFIAAGALRLESSFIKKIPEDSLDYFVKALAPIVNSQQVEIMNTLLLKGSVESKQFFIHRYWTEQAGKFADEAFAAYMEVAKAVDAMYRSGFGYGFETDRGHIFLKYGRPDDIQAVEDEPSAPPYEIWFYNQFPATHQSNVRFLFYNPSLATNAFKLLHSTAIGEIHNERWEIELYRDATLETPGVNEKVMGDNVHRNARKYFETY